MLPSNDLLDVERQEIGIVLVKAAVFTASTCSLTDEGPQSSVHHSPRELARSCRAFDLSVATNVP